MSIPTGDAKDGGQFAWWKNPSLQRIAAMATEAALKNGRMEVHRLTGGSYYVEFFDGDGTEIGGEDDSFICPPICP